MMAETEGSTVDVTRAAVPLFKESQLGATVGEFEPVKQRKRERKKEVPEKNGSGTQVIKTNGAVNCKRLDATDLYWASMMYGADLILHFDS